MWLMGAAEKNLALPAAGGSEEPFPTHYQTLIVRDTMYQLALKRIDLYARQARGEARVFDAAMSAAFDV